MNDRTPTEATWKLVPTEATDKMAEAFSEACLRKLQDAYGASPTEPPEEGGGSFGYGYRAMLAASPPAPAAEVEPVAWGEFYGGRCAAVRLDRSVHCQTPLYTHPSTQQRSAPAAGLVLRLSVHRMMGMYGAAYDGPKDARAYTFKHQPGNQSAWQMGKAASAAAKEPGGDYIDGGLALLRHLEAEGFGVFVLVKDEPLEPHPLDAATIRAEARREALEDAERIIRRHVRNTIDLRGAIEDIRALSGALAEKGEAE